MGISSNPIRTILLDPPAWIQVILWLSFAYVAFRTVAVGMLRSAIGQAWILAKLYRVPLSLFQLATLGLRGHDTKKLVRGCIMVGDAELNLSIRTAIAHLRSGGDPEAVAVALVAAQHAGLAMTAADLLAADLRQEDPLQLVQRAVARETDLRADPGAGIGTDGV